MVVLINYMVKNKNVLLKLYHKKQNVKHKGYIKYDTHLRIRKFFLIYKCNKDTKIFIGEIN